MARTAYLLHGNTNFVEIHHREDGIRDRSPSRGLGDVYKRQAQKLLAVEHSAIFARRACRMNIITSRKAHINSEYRTYNTYFRWS